MADEEEAQERKMLIFASKILWAVSGLLFVGLLLVVRSQIEQDDRLQRGRDQRIGYQADQMYIQCELTRDDVEMLPQNQADQVNEICAGYRTPEQALETEKNRK